MPNRYEREIEELLRNLEQTGPKPGLGQRLSGRLRRRPRTRGHSMREPQRGTFSFHRTLPEWLLITAIAIALVAGGWAYAEGPNLFTAILAIMSFACLLVVTFSHFLFGSHRPQATGYRTRRRSPFRSIKTQWDIFMLKIRYRRRGH